MAYQISEKTSSSWVATAPGRERVLVVDDDPHFRVLVRAILEPEGFQILESESMENCLAQLRRHSVEAVILDMVMPGGDGIEAVRQMKRQFPAVRILTVSGADRSDLYLSLSAHLGADASLEKSRISALSPLLQVVLDR